MDTPHSQLEALLELEARHDDLLERLDALDKRVAKVLAQYLPGRDRDAQPCAAGPDPG